MRGRGHGIGVSGGLSELLRSTFGCFRGLTRGERHPREEEAGREEHRVGFEGVARL